MSAPSVGRIVHFYTDEAAKWSNGRQVVEGPFAAIITNVRVDGTVDLECFGERFHSEQEDRLGGLPCGIPFDEEEGPPAHECWRWPPRV